MLRRFENVAAFEAAVGEKLGPSDWVTVTQSMIDGFADATGDHQWIHVDPVRAAIGPFGCTIAHGYLTQSLIPVLTESLWRIDNLAMAVNYGADRVRFPRPVPVGSRLRATATLTAVELTASGTRATVSYVVEIADADKPACVADVVYLLTSA